MMIALILIAALAAAVATVIVYSYNSDQDRRRKVRTGKISTPVRLKSRSGKMATPIRIVSSLVSKTIPNSYGPLHPLTIMFALLLIAGFVTSLTMLIIYILNPDKEPLPWRTYCQQQSPFPHAYADALAPVNIMVGVMTIDSKFERRNMIRSTYARHTNPRDSNGQPLANVQVKFILGRVRKAHARHVALEMEAYNDIVVLDMDETQSARKTLSYFKWATENATVPFLRPVGTANDYIGGSTDTYVPSASDPGGLTSWEYDSRLREDDHQRAGSSAHDRAASQDGTDSETMRYQVGWRKVDYVVKADDDTFIVLDELERHLRVAPRKMTYWGYLVKNWFMGGEAYALSYDLVEWLARTPEVSHTAKGKEDTRTPQWLAIHPNRSLINWVSEHCWIYDHPKGASPYSHGFLFPDYVEKIKLEERRGLSEEEIAFRGGERRSQSYSTVSKWHETYKEPRCDLTVEEEVEALVEGGGRWAGTWVRGPDGSTGETWVPYNDIVYASDDFRLSPSSTDAAGNVVLASDVGLEPYSGLPIYGSADHIISRAVGVANDTTGTAVPPAKAQTPRRDDREFGTHPRRDLLSDLEELPRKMMGYESAQRELANGAARNGPVGGRSTSRNRSHVVPRPTPKDSYGEWSSLQARRYLHRPHGGTVIVHYLKKSEWWLETALALSGKPRLWENGAGGRGKEWRMGGSPLVRSDGYISEGRNAPLRSVLGTADGSRNVPYKLVRDDGSVKAPLRGVLDVATDGEVGEDPREEVVTPGGPPEKDTSITSSSHPQDSAQQEPRIRKGKGKINSGPLAPRGGTPFGKPF